MVVSFVFFPAFYFGFLLVRVFQSGKEFRQISEVRSSFN